MLKESLSISLKYIGGVALFAAASSVFLWIAGGWEYGVAFFMLAFIGGNAVGCYSSFKARGVIQGLMFMFTFVLVGGALAALIGTSLVALGKWA